MLAAMMPVYFTPWAETHEADIVIGHKFAINKYDQVQAMKNCAVQVNANWNDTYCDTVFQ